MLGAWCMFGRTVLKWLYVCGLAVEVIEKFPMFDIFHPGYFSWPASKPIKKHPTGVWHNHQMSVYGLCLSIELTVATNCKQLENLIFIWHHIDLLPSIVCKLGSFRGNILHGVHTYW